MGIETVVNSVYNNRVTFGTNLELQDGNLVIEDQLFPNRVALIGACSNSEKDPDNETEYLIPTNQPTPIAKLEDLAFLRNDDPDRTPSEILLAFRDAYDGGARTFEVVIISRSVAQLGEDIDASDTIIPVNTIYTGKVARMLDTGIHPTGNTHFASFVHNGDFFVAGGERPDTPATGDLTSAQSASAGWQDSTGQYITFTHSDGRVKGIWADTTGAETIPAALQTLIDAGTAGSEAFMIDVSGSDTALQNAAKIADIINNSFSDFDFLAFDGGTGTVDLISTAAGTAGNSWTMDVSNAPDGITGSTAISGGAATNTVSDLVFYYDVSADAWKALLDTNSEFAVKMTAAARDMGAISKSTTEIQLIGGMTTILGGADTATDNIQIITFDSASLSTATSIADEGFNLSTGALGEACWVDTGSAVYVFGGQTGSTSRTDFVGTYATGTGVVTDTTDDLPAATRWLGGYYEPVSDRIYVFGGETSGGAIDTTSVYDVAGTAFLAAGTAGRMTQKKYAFATAAINGAAYVFGGQLASGESDKIDRFDPDTLTWSNRDLLVSAASGGGAVVISNRVYYAEDTQGGKYNVGIGNLDDQYVGFTDEADLGTDPLYLQCEWEIMLVSSYTTTRVNGRDTDAFVVTRGQRGSTAIAHLDRVDVVNDPEVLHTQLSDAFAEMANLSLADYVVMPHRATADCPYLTATKNFAHLAGFYCVFKTSYERTVLAALGVHPANENPRVEYTRAQETTWVDYLNNYNRQNYESAYHWKIGDGHTDADGDNKPDTYALWFVKDGSIPTGAPPMDSGAVELDSNSRPIDLGKHLVIVASQGFATSREYAEKFPSAGRGYMRSGHAHFAGMLSVLDASVGSTGVPARGFTPVRPLSLINENDLITNRYVIVVQRSNGFRWSNGFTFAYNVSKTSRSDWVLASSVRRAAGLTRAIRRIIDVYIGKSTDRQTRTAMDVDIAQKIQNFVGAGIVGPRTTHRTEIDETDAILAYAKVYLSIQIPGELINIDMIAALTV